jgi:hypothetical protein
MIDNHLHPNTSEIALGELDGVLQVFRSKKRDGNGAGAAAIFGS